MKKLKYYFHKIFKRTDFSGLSVFGRGQHADWEILLVFLVVILVGSVSFSINVFLDVRSGNAFQDDYKPPVRNMTIDKNKLSEVVKSFEKKAENLAAIQAQKKVFIDPSL
jgi:hypothetical protein